MTLTNVSHAPSAGSSLSFPHDVFASLAPAPFLAAHLLQSSKSTKSKPCRPNGRAPLEFRTPSINVGSLSHASGSAVVRLGDTAAVTGVRAEILRVQDIPNVPKVVKEWRPQGKIDGDQNGINRSTENTPLRMTKGVAEIDEIELLGLVVPNVELSTACPPRSGGAPGPLAQSLTQRILNLLQYASLIRVDDLRITYPLPNLADSDAVAAASEALEASNDVQTVAFWVLYIDIIFISVDGAVFDTAWAATIAALQNVLLPQAKWDPDLNNVICDTSSSNARKLEIHRMPMSLSFVAFQVTNSGLGSNYDVVGDDDANIKDSNYILADPDSFEETVCDESLTLVIDRENDKTTILSFEKYGGSSIDTKDIDQLVTVAERRWNDWHEWYISIHNNDTEMKDVD